jgi:hypothetical protein
VPLDRFEVKDGVLTLTPDGKAGRKFERLAKEPPELVPQAPVLAERKPVPPERVRAICAELARREQANLRVRMEYREAMKDRQKAQAKYQEMARIDADDTKYLTGLLGEVGWIDEPRFGADAAHSAYLIAMHTKDFGLMGAAVAELEKETRAKRFDPEQFAGLHDRHRSLTGQLERYGVHVSRDEKGELVVGPLEAPKRVDEFRKAIGLTPLAEYLRRYKVDNGGKEVRVLNR